MNNPREGSATITGRRFTKYQAAEYQRWNQMAMEYQAEGRPVPETVLNSRHKAYCMAMYYGVDS